MKDNSDKIIADKIVQFTSLSNKNVLEIGCGNGRITSFLVNKAKKLIAIEPDFTKIREAKENIPGVAFQIASGENLPPLKRFFRSCYLYAIPSSPKQ